MKFRQQCEEIKIQKEIIDRFHPSEKFYFYQTSEKSIEIGSN